MLTLCFKKQYTTKLYTTMSTRSMRLFIVVLLRFFLFRSSMSAENFAVIAIRCSKRCFARTFDIPSYVSKTFYEMVCFVVRSSSLKPLARLGSGV